LAGIGKIILQFKIRQGLTGAGRKIIPSLIHLGGGDYNNPVPALPSKKQKA